MPCCGLRWKMYWLAMEGVLVLLLTESVR